MLHVWLQSRHINDVRTKMLKKMVGEDEILNTKSKIESTKLSPCQDIHYKRAATPLYDFPNLQNVGQIWIKSSNILEHG